MRGRSKPPKLGKTPVSCGAAAAGKRLDCRPAGPRALGPSVAPKPMTGMATAPTPGRTPRPGPLGRGRPCRRRMRMRLPPKRERRTEKRPGDRRHARIVLHQA